MPRFFIGFFFLSISFSCPLFSQIKTINIDVVEDSQILGSIDLKSNGFFFITGHEKGAPKNPNYRIHRYTVDLEKIYSVDIPYEEGFLVNHFEDMLFSTKLGNWAYFLEKEKNFYKITQIDSVGNLRTTKLNYQKTKGWDISIFVTDRGLNLISRQDDSKGNYYLVRLPHKRLKPARPVQLYLPKLSEKDEQRHLRWSLVNFNDDEMIFIKRSVVDYGYYHKPLTEVDHTFLSLNYEGKVAGEDSVKIKLSPGLNLASTRWRKKALMSSQYSGTFFNQHISSKYRRGIILENAPDYSYAMSSTGGNVPTEKFNATPNSLTDVYPAQNNGYTIMGLIEDDEKSWKFQGYFISSIDSNWNLISHKEFFAPEDKLWKRHELKPRLNIPFFHKMEHEESGKKTIKFFRQEDYYLVVLDEKDNEIKHEVIKDLGKLDRHRRPLDYDRVVYHREHPIMQYMEEMDLDLLMELDGFMNLRAFKATPETEIFMHFTNDDRDELRLILFDAS